VSPIIICPVRDVLQAWGGLRVVRPLSGGSRNEVVEVVDVRGQRLVARAGRRAGPALEWELDLLEQLALLGFIVAPVVPTTDGRRQVGGVVVQEWMEGEPPTGGDWAAVASELRRLHSATVGWRQRPSFRSSRDLLSRERGGDVDLSVMPQDAVRACRAAWRGLGDVPFSVVHGDPGAANIRITAGGVGFLDWDESRVDHGDLDLAALPGVTLPLERLARARAAVHAWEAATGWRAEPDYARTRLALLGPDPDGGA
jgi:Ser/Thr protein kinase RdoA (MazF antagonist)